MTCGIYAIVNNKNNKIYIGSATNIEESIRFHKWAVSKKQSRLSKNFKNLIFEYRDIVFDYVIINVCKEYELKTYLSKYLNMFLKLSRNDLLNSDLSIIKEKKPIELEKLKKRIKKVDLRLSKEEIQLFNCIKRIETANTVRRRFSNTLEKENKTNNIISPP